MAAHTKAQKEFIVRRLAAFESPRDVAASFAARFPGVPCREQDVLATDPRGNVVDPELTTLFYEERKRVLDDPDAAPFADQKARLIVLSRQAERYENNNQLAEARAVFRQIAEELGVVGGKGKPQETKGAVGGQPVTGITRTIIDAPKHSDAAGVPAVASTESV